MRSSYIFFFLITISVGVSAQDSSNLNFEEYLEFYFEFIDLEDEEEISEEYIDHLHYLYVNPIDLNTADIELLQSIPGFTFVQARQVLSIRSQTMFDSISELTKVSGIDLEYLTLISPFIWVQKSNSEISQTSSENDTRYRIEFISRLQRAIEDQEGYEREDSLGGFLGNPIKYYQRLNIQRNDISFNLTQEKDPGEYLNSLDEFDFNSWHISIQDQKLFRQLIVGDYSMNSGQGLVIWTSKGFGKGRNVVNLIRKTDRGIRPYSSSNESDFFRGGAVSFGDSFQLTALYSNREKSATRIGIDSTRFPTHSGFHRTLNELEKKNTLTEQLVGGRLKLITKIGEFGTTAYSVNYSSYISNSDAVYNKYDFNGDQHQVYGLDYNLYATSLHVFGEWAMDRQGGQANVIGFQTHMFMNTSVALCYRDYKKDFQSIFGNGFGETASTQNEEGIYFGVEHDINPKLELSGYIDYYKFAAPTFRNNQSSQGVDFLGSVDIAINQQWKLYLLIRSEYQEREHKFINDYGRSENNLGEIHKRSIRLHSENTFGKNLRLRSRVEASFFSNVNDDKEVGYLVYQDIRFMPLNNLQIDARITFFDTDGFNSRVYQFENDLLYVMTNTLLHNEGLRRYFVLKYSPSRWLQIWLKYSSTAYENVAFVGSGLQRIRGNRKSQFGIQIRMLFK